MGPRLAQVFYSGPLAKVLSSRPGPFFIYFRLFKHTLQFLQQINVKNFHLVYGAGIRTLEH